MKIIGNPLNVRGKFFGEGVLMTGKLLAKLGMRQETL